MKIKLILHKSTQIKNYVDQKDKTVDQDIKENISISKLDLDRIFISKMIQIKHYVDQKDNTLGQYIKECGAK